MTDNDKCAESLTSSTATEDVESKNIFEAERKALLAGMASKLQGVIQRMSKVNKNLNTLSNDSDSVSNLSKLWQESYLISKEIGRKEERNGPIAESSLLVFKKN